MENVTVLEREDCDLLYDALKAYICHLDMIKLSCRHPVTMDGSPIEARIAKARRLKSIVYPRTTKAGKENEHKA